MLNPADFVFLWDDCPRCYYRKYVLGKPRPTLDFPRVFAQIDGRMKAAFVGAPLHELARNAPEGEVIRTSGRVRSRALPVEGSNSLVTLAGSYDALARRKHGGYAILDYKTSSGGEKIAFRYARQLHAYAWALERAASGEESATPVTMLGLVVFAPEAFVAGSGRGTLSGAVTFWPIPRDDVAFSRMLARIVATLDASEPPPANPECAWCPYRADGWRDAGRHLPQARVPCDLSREREGLLRVANGTMPRTKTARGSAVYALAVVAVLAIGGVDARAAAARVVLVHVVLHACRRSRRGLSPRACAAALAGTRDARTTPR